ncbi:hypothetical protein X943_000161 [Babesia divergens]|uniref:Uncharacterized protein n=1 Tax=Babesia divergens TaxID=32595 RepID=A0AAD9GLC8_BABDI|nr:hypothetical protein X943_000161 [Babesia divergens]
MDCDIERGIDDKQHTLRHLSSSFGVCASKCRHRGAAFRGGLAGRCLEGVVELFDANGCLLQHGSVTINAVLSRHSDVFGGDATVLHRDVNIVALSGSRFKLSYMVDIAGSWVLSVVLSTGEHLAGSPFDIEIDAAEASPYTTTLGYVKQHSYKSQQKEFIIQVKDGFGNKLRRGGTRLLATCLGAGQVLSLYDCNNGMYRVICDTEPTSSFSQLRVTLMGKDIVNSPFALSSPVKTRASVANPDPFERAFDKYKQRLDKNAEIGSMYSDLCASLVKEQREAVKSYHSTRLQIVHTLPVIFTIDEPDQSLEEQRKQLIDRHARLNEEIEELSAKVRHADDACKEVIDDLVRRVDISTKLHKEAVDAYNIVRSDIEKRTASIGDRQRLISAVKDGDKDAIKRLEESQTLQRAIASYYRGSEKPKDAGKRTQLVSRQYMTNEISSAMISVKPDRPNTLAFWMVEGRFKPSQKA